MPDPQRVILASASVYRQRMLQAAGVACEVRPADIDEVGLRKVYARELPSPPPAEVALRLAEEKAVTVSRAAVDALVIGSDQVLEIGGDVLSKPPTLAAAREQLLALRGRTHTLPTAVAIAWNGAVTWRHVEAPRLTMRNFDDDFLDDYISKVGLAVTTTVGGYQVEGLGAQLMERIEGDYFAIVGLPLLPLLAALRARGVGLQ